MTRREIFRLIRVRGRHEWENPPVSLGRIAILGCEREGFVRTLSALLFCLVAAVSVAHADVKHVANFGVDSPDCGLQETPCRSISQAIRNASEGDTVFVGPGLYGDLNHNGVVGELGEEGASIPSGESCLVCVSKRLTLLSQRGAAHTTIDARNLPLTAVTLSRKLRASIVEPPRLQPH